MAGPDLPQPFLRQHGFGIEKKLEKAGETLDDVIGGLIARKIKDMSEEIVLKDDAKGVDLLTSMITEQQSFTDGSKTLTITSRLYPPVPFQHMARVKA
ncbi:hypothetical protein Tco_0321051 [Tanacetum coccineum]